MALWRWRVGSKKTLATGQIGRALAALSQPAVGKHADQPISIQSTSGRGVETFL
jgi:hypothetical protein